jgi:hypothetical protein
MPQIAAEAQQFCCSARVWSWSIAVSLWRAAEMGWAAELAASVENDPIADVGRVNSDNVVAQVSRFWPNGHGAV